MPRRDWLVPIGLLLIIAGPLLALAASGDADYDNNLCITCGPVRPRR